MRDFFAQRGDAAGGAVAIAARCDGVSKRIDDRRCGMKVGLAKFQMNDGAALALEFLGAGENGERAFTSKL